MPAQFYPEDAFLHRIQVKLRKPLKKDKPPLAVFGG
jgi:hypothetical protein